MTHPTQTQLAELRAEVARQLTRLEASMVVSDEAVKVVPLDQSAVGRLSRMDSLQSQSMAKGLREREAGRLGQLQGAMRRLEEGTFGVCTGCGGDLAFERLLVFPESATCLGCG